MTYEIIKERYLKNYIRDDQLLRFKDLGIITYEQYAELYEIKHPTEQSQYDESVSVQQ